jgi:hypothetical protein
MAHRPICPLQNIDRQSVFIPSWEHFVTNLPSDMAPAVTFHVNEWAQKSLQSRNWEGPP